MNDLKFLEYKNYRGSIEYSPIDNCFFGKILSIDDLILYEGDTIEQLEESFHELVDDYIKAKKILSKEIK